LKFTISKFKPDEVRGSDANFSEGKQT